MPPVTGIRDLAVAPARVLVATALTGPVAGVNVAAGTVIDTIAARFSGGRESAYDKAVRRVAGP